MKNEVFEFSYEAFLLIKRKKRLKNKPELNYN